MDQDQLEKVYREFLAYQDIDSSIFLLIWFPFVLACNGVHTYIMYTWSQVWAEGSFILIIQTVLHYLQSLCSILLIYSDPEYRFKWKDVRFISLSYAWFYLFLVIVGLMLEVYLIFYSNQVAGFLISMYVGYELLVGITIIPQHLAILVYESTGNILERDVKYSRAGSYISIFEFLAESLGYYEQDWRIHSWI